ncbi:hypothetical protein Ssi03_25930 [Sphaerisporangium siamense]|uniref:Uncharacterized protein n=1 Tax=Sphaerisporangium siamense TaxID=795645 RepID=A0A7W7D4B9_9ACTN|nr:hypothetical protein [Sphaerisporangium siamense]MBB4700080.1 hypothetical protein [Sphaerisporangium siamense]GII84603.1 hypothetical protein Ssi03_25930 [Sphaerisporangium siamense]
MPGNDGELSFAEKIRTLQFATGQTRPRRRETRDEDGRRRRVVTERTDSGAIAQVTNRSDARGDHQDVTIHAPLITGVGKAVNA